MKQASGSMSDATRSVCLIGCWLGGNQATSFDVAHDDQELGFSARPGDTYFVLAKHAGFTAK
ncbi:hypothetical protein [Brevundimonas vesicularis]|uniref:hypothetical protein n=1 Tax=Brevundimonas vesicularis TaxID=41276 RepID=UPI00384D2EE4